MGRSIIETPSEFYGPVIDWLSDYKSPGKKDMTVDLGFEFVNSGSTKWLYLLLRKLEEIKENSETMKIRWFYETGDDDMRELGFILKSLVDCSFTIIEVKELNESLYDNFLNESN